MRVLFVILLVGIVISLLGCSSAKEDYVNLEQVLMSNEQVLQNTHDFDTRTELCENAISVIEKYLAEHTEGQWPTIARASLNNWQQHLEETRGAQTQLLEELHAMLKTRSKNAAQKHHPLSNIEECNLAGSTESKQGANLCITDTYDIKMRGNVIGHNVFRLTAEASGCIISTTQIITAVGDVTLRE